MSEADDDLQYDVMVESALRGVVRQALRQVAERGLPGEHHFYITFRTDHPGVRIAPRLKERYPQEMTIVLQHQFWDLAVGEEAFSVALSFDNRAEALEIPFAAVVAFADPSVRFGLQFEAGDEDSESTAEDRAGGHAPVAAGQDAETATKDGEDDGDNVITLDRFRRS